MAKGKGKRRISEAIQSDPSVSLPARQPRSPVGYVDKAAKDRATTVRVILSTVGRNAYTVTLENGQRLIDETASPELSAARALIAKGYTGLMVTRWAGSQFDAVRLPLRSVAVRDARRAMA